MTSHLPSPPRQRPAPVDPAAYADVLGPFPEHIGGNGHHDQPDMEQLAEQHTGQARFAHLLAGEYADRLLYVHGIGWHYWDSARWAEDHGAAHAGRAVLKILRAAHAAAFNDKDAVGEVRRCNTAAGVNGILDIARRLVPFHVKVTDLDADPYLLNCANGTLDLRTLELRPHCPADRITKVTRAAYNPEARGELWDSFLARVLPDPDVRAFLARYAGLGLCGAILEHLLGIATGVGANGKSVFVNTLGHALGDYAIAAEPELFLHRDGAHPTGEMDLRGVRWAALQETDKGKRLAEATVKRLTGGDKIKARRMRQDFVEFAPSHTALMSTNHLPKVSGDDPALWRRIRVIPFDVVIPADERDPRLTEKLEAEADAVLAWAVAGWAAYQSGGMADPDAVKVATDRYHADSDAVARFLDERTMPSPVGRVSIGDLWEAWCRWADEDGADKGGKKDFSTALENRGYRQRKSNGRRIWDGLALYADDSEDDR